MRLAVFTLGALLALAPAAQAAPPQTVAGVKLTWPARATVKPGATVSLRVRSVQRRARVAFLSGKTVLARRTLRNGTFRATVPAGAGKTYTLQATVAGRRYAKTLRTAACSGTGVMTSPSQLAAPGGAIDFVVENRGATCITVPTSHLQLSWIGADGRAAPLDCDGNVKRPDDLRLCTPTLPIELAPGAQHTISGHVPAGLAAGSYTVRLGTMSTTVRVDACIGPFSPGTAEVRLGATSVAAGGALPYTVFNPGPGCLGIGVDFQLERLEADGTYRRVVLPYVWPAIAILIPPGAASDFTARIPADLAPGTYRITHAGGQASFQVT